MSRKAFVCGNWKMHRNTGETVALVRELRAKLNESASVEVGIAPPFTALAAAGQALVGSFIRLAGQNCHFEKQGAFTGEVSAAMLKDVGCDTVILGHSERRQYFGETDGVVNKRARAALDEGLTPIVCVGETLAEREGGRTLAVVGAQVKACLSGFSAKDVEAAVIAYEPVWAIGTGKVATPAQVQEVHLAIRGWLAELGGKAAADKCRIQYGGSVKPDNAAELMALPDVDGALVGGASLKADDFAKIVAAAKRR
jgi:triosephosphate isomerase